MKIRADSPELLVSNKSIKLDCGCQFTDIGRGLAINWCEGHRHAPFFRKVADQSTALVKAFAELDPADAVGFIDLRTRARAWLEYILEDDKPDEEEE